MLAYRHICRFSIARLSVSLQLSEGFYATLRTTIAKNGYIDSTKTNVYLYERSISRTVSVAIGKQLWDTLDVTCRNKYWQTIRCAFERLLTRILILMRSWHTFLANNDFITFGEFPDSLIYDSVNCLTQKRTYKHSWESETSEKEILCWSKNNLLFLQNWKPLQLRSSLKDASSSEFCSSDIVIRLNRAAKRTRKANWKTWWEKESTARDIVLIQSKFYLAIERTHRRQNSRNFSLFVSQ